MTGRTYIVPPIVVDFRNQSDPPNSDGVITYSGVQPNERRGLYRHCYGVRGFVWSVHGSFERTYYFTPDYVDGALREHLESTVVTLAAVIRSELEAAIAAPNAYGEKVQEFLRARGTKQDSGTGAK